MGAENEGKTSYTVLGILAHVDAGKTTLSEALLFASGRIRTPGRVDKRNTFLDTDEMERDRGITIFSKQAVFSAVTPGVEREYILLDTPGHADFSPETERTLSVLDMAVLIVTAPDGVNAQVRLLYDLLDHYGVPVVFFVNKMDQAEARGDAVRRKAGVLEEIRRELSGNAADFTDGEDSRELQETLALASEDEALLESVMQGGRIGTGKIREMIRERKVFPVLFGSALRQEGVPELLALIDRYAPSAEDSGTFGARVFKITRDPQGERLTWMKVTGGALRVREEIPMPAPVRPEAASGAEEDENGETEFQEEVREKVTQIRLYSGEKYTALPEAPCGMVCAVAGLSGTWAGQGLGAESGISGGPGLIRPVLTWKILLEPNEDPFRAYRMLSTLSEEDPMLSVDYDERKREITARLMGPIQREVLAQQVRKRFGLVIGFGQPQVIYRETIARPVEGVGHFEPLRHYAEVHLLLEPGEPGSGLVYGTTCPTDRLASSYQKLVLSQLAGRRHRGVLTGSEITDMKITLIAGRAHVKHTEGGDFRQAAFRAMRQGLMCAESVLLEPFYDFVLTLPSRNLGRALADLNAMGASFGAPETDGERASLKGSAPVAAIGTYAETLRTYTKGEGILSLRVSGYRPCRDPESVIASIGYDPDLDRGQPAASVFCMHGAGTVVPWYDVRSYMHVDSGWRGEDGERPDSGFVYGPSAESPEQTAVQPAVSAKRREERERSFREREADRFAAEDELMAIFEKTYGPVRREMPAERRVVGPAVPAKKMKARPRPEKEYLLVDGYNMIFAWEELRDLAKADVKAARDRLLDLLSDYAGYIKKNVICVFDAYRVENGKEQVYRYHNLDVIFTKEAETADHYIEKTAREMSRRYGVTVATSDAVEQVIIFGAGAMRLSARDLLGEMIRTKREMAGRFLDVPQVGDGHLRESLADKVRAAGDLDSLP